jgi:hypothetical protein
MLFSKWPASGSSQELAEATHYVFARRSANPNQDPWRQTYTAAAPRLKTLPGGLATWRRKPNPLGPRP